MKEKPDAKAQIGPILTELGDQWEDLEDTTKSKGEKLFDSHRAVLYEQSCDDIDGWITGLEAQIVTEDFGKDLTTANLLMQKQNVSFHSTFVLLMFSFKFMLMSVFCRFWIQVSLIEFKLVFLVLLFLLANHFHWRH